ncbi:MAG: cytochrome c oxidase subunit II [Thermoanaerobaculia bacterium]
MNFKIPFVPEQASELAGEVDRLTFFLVGMSTFFTVLIAAMVIVFAIKYRRRSPDEVGSAFENSAFLEITWTVIPLLIVLFTFGWGLKVFFRLYKPPADAVEYYVTGKQWMWKLQHPTGQREINELHVPVGQSTRLIMTSEDVIHSFFVPAFRVKADVVPGRTSSLWFKPTKTGRYHLFCTEFCGAEHSKMIGTVVVQEPGEYEAWLSGVPAAKSSGGAGAQLFAQYACDTCHKAEPGGRGPILHGIVGTEVTLASGEKVLVDDAYIRESILMPTAKIVQGYEPLMPSFQGQLSDETLNQLVTYVKSLSPTQSAANDAAAQGIAR